MSLPMAMGMGISGSAVHRRRHPGLLGQPHARARRAMDAYGAMTPFCRCHNEAGERDQYPWSFGPGVEKRSRAALELRYRLLPYIYSAFVRAARPANRSSAPSCTTFNRQARARNGRRLPVRRRAPGRTGARAGTDGSSRVPASGNLGRLVHGRATPGRQFITASARSTEFRSSRAAGRIIPSYATAPRSTMDHHPEAIDLHVVDSGRRR